MTAGSVIAKATGQGSIVIAAPAPRRACQKTVPSAAAAGDASVASASALCQEHLGTSVKNAQHAETPVALQGESTLVAPSVLQ